MTLTLALGNETATAQLMADLALLIGPGDVIALRGDLGAGKTAAARALIRHLAGDDELEVPSPTFTLAQTYDLPACPVLHADLYRIGDPSELEEIGLSPLPEGTLVLIEWPERAGPLLPADRIDLELTHRPALGASARAAAITGHGRCIETVERLAALREFLDAAGFIAAQRQRMAGDASIRSYARLIRDEGSYVLMNSPKRPDGPAIYHGKPYSAAVHLAEDVIPFVAVAHGLRSAGISAPEILHADLDCGFLITEDLGSESVVEGTPPAPIAERYEAATDLLAVLHGEPRPARLAFAPQRDYVLPPFDIEAMLIEISLMLDWYLPDRGVALADDARAAFMALWRGILAPVIAQPATWMLRDYHSPNLIWLPARSGTDRIGVIDFQDTVMGPPAYDLVSLLQDARVDVPETLEIALLTRYARARRATEKSFDPAAFAASYAIMSAQRNTRLLGTFARLNRRDGKPHYLKHQPRIWTYLQRALAHPALAELKAWFAAHVPPPAPPDA